MHPLGYGTGVGPMDTTVDLLGKRWQRDDDEIEDAPPLKKAKVVTEVEVHLARQEPDEYIQNTHTPSAPNNPHAIFLSATLD